MRRASDVDMLFNMNGVIEINYNVDNSIQFKQFN